MVEAVVERPVAKTAKTLRDARQWLRCSEDELDEAISTGLLPVYVLLEHTDADLLRPVNRQRTARLTGYFRIEEYVSDTNAARFEFGIVVAVEELGRSAVVRERYTLECDPRCVLSDDLERYRREHLPSPTPKPAPDDPKPTGRRSQVHRERCRAIASVIWEREPALTIEAMIDRPEITRVGQQDTPYDRKTLRNWIKDLCPNPRPGRPRKLP